MLYLIGLIIPPLGVLLCGKPFQAIFNFTLLVLGLLIFVGTLGLANGITFVIWIGCIVHAWFTAHGRNQAVRDQKIVDALTKKIKPD